MQKEIEKILKNYGYTFIDGKYNGVNIYTTEFYNREESKMYTMTIQENYDKPEGDQIINPDDIPF